MKEKKMTQEEFYTVHQPSFLVVFLANKNKINSLLNVLNVIFFFYKKLFFSLLLFKIHKKKVTKMVNTLSFYRSKTIFDRSKFF